MGKQIRKQKKSSIIAGGFFRFALYLCVIVGISDWKNLKEKGIN